MGKKVPVKETAGVSFWRHGTGQRGMERGWEVGSREAEETKTHQPRFRSCCNGLGRKC